MTSPNEPRNPYDNYNSGQQYPQGQYGPPSYDQGQYPQGGYAPQYGGYGYPSPLQYQGQQMAQTSMILGIISLFALGIILGPLAISKANKAEREFNTPATVGKVTGWIGTILALVTIIGIVLYAILVIGLVASSEAGF